MRLCVRREPGIGQCRDVHRLQTGAAPHRQRRAASFHSHTGFAQLVQNGVHMVRARLAQGDLAVRGCGGDGKRGRFDAVGNHFVLRAVQFPDAGDGDGGTARADNPRAHRVEKSGQVHHFRLACGALDQRHAFGQDGGHHYVGGAQHGRPRATAQKDIAAGQARRPGADVTALDRDARSQPAQSLPVQINRPRADHAAARQ